MQKRDIWTGVYASARVLHNSEIRGDDSVTVMCTDCRNKLREEV